MTDDELNEQIKALAEAKGFRIAKAYEVAPWDCSDDGPAPGSSDWAYHYRRAQAFRRALIAEIKAAKEKPKRR
jgi:hypothetical protein